MDKFRKLAANCEEINQMQSEGTSFWAIVRCNGKVKIILMIFTKTERLG
jgi:hypothetical protein